MRHTLKTSVLFLFAAAACNPTYLAPAHPHAPSDPGTPSMTGSGSPGSPQDPGMTSPTPPATMPAAACTVGTPSGPLEVATTRGIVRGKQLQGSMAFLGIPFAEPPVGALRFHAPVEHACWSDVKDATQYGNECPQRNVITNLVEGDEDCLFANVWTPHIGASARLPVLVFLYGGANVIGANDMNAGSDLTGNMYDGQALAERENAVVVAPNYRLGALGFLTHPALDAENDDHVSGNYAVLDQIAALTWVKANIAAFGGDPDRVMVFGESAGAINTCVLLASPRAAGLFESALMESGYCDAVPLAVAEQHHAPIVHTLGCDAASDPSACLRRVSAKQIVEATPSFATQLIDLSRMGLSGSLAEQLPFSAVVDGHVLPDRPLSLIRAGRHNHAAFAAGSNAQEMALFLVKPVVVCAQYENDVRTYFPSQGDAVLAHYPCSDYLTPQLAEIDALTDMVFTCPTRAVVRAMADTQAEPVFRYYFTHRAAYGAQAALGAFHAAELAYVFAAFTTVGYVPLPSDTALSNHIQDYWATFAASGDPDNGRGALRWPSYRTGAETSLVLDEPLAVQSDVKAAKCDFWDAFVP